MIEKAYKLLIFRAKSLSFVKKSKNLQEKELHENFIYFVQYRLLWHNF